MDLDDKLIELRQRFEGAFKQGHAARISQVRAVDPEAILGDLAEHSGWFCGFVAAGDAKGGGNVATGRECAEGFLDAMRAQLEGGR